MFLGEPIDQAGPIGRKKRMSIHRNPPSFADQAGSTEILETGVKVIDLLCPFAKGGKVGLFGGAGVGKTVNMMELIRNICNLSTVVILYLRELANVLVKVMISIMK